MLFVAVVCCAAVLGQAQEEDAEVSVTINCISYIRRYVCINVCVYICVCMCVYVCM